MVNYCTVGLLLSHLLVASARELETVDVFVPKRDGFVSIRIPSVVVTNKGSVLAFAEGRAADADQAKNRIVGKRSTDGGKTWSKITVVAQDGDKALNNPCVVVEKVSGNVMMMYQSYPAGIGERSGKILPGYEGESIVRNWLIVSGDDGLTWSAPRDVTRETKREQIVTTLAGGPGIGIQLRQGKHAGRLLMPFNEGPFGVWNVYAVYSDDAGKTWKRGDVAPGCVIDGAKGQKTSLVNEAQFVELSDGRVRFNIRRWAGKAVRKSCVSNDGGVTWSKIEDVPELADPGCMGSVYRLGDKVLYSGPLGPKRENGTVFVSEDDGKTWPIHRALCKEAFAYSCLTSLADGTIGCLYEAEGTSKIVFVRFTFDWLTEKQKTHWAELRAVDALTGRGVPLVEFETVNGLKYITDNSGRVAFDEPDLMDREVYFHVRSHGYSVKKDGFGYAGVRITPKAGSIAEIRLTRTNIAERLCRLTGEGLFRDSMLLGYDVPIASHLGKVGGQDSVQAIEYHGKIYWLWGDTHRMDYPLGLFRTAGATTPSVQTTDPANGIAFNYFVEKNGFTRAMMPLAERPEGVVWVFALAVVPNAEGVEKLVAHYTRRKGLDVELEQGIALFDDGKRIFESAQQLPLSEVWRKPMGHPIPYTENNVKWLLFGSPTPNVRVPATLKAILDPTQYEAFTCASVDRPAEPELDGTGKPVWKWQTKLPPMDSKTERGWVKSLKIKPEDARFCPADVVNPQDRIVLHSGSVRWNPYRNRWVMVAGQVGGKTSHLGEVWYAEADAPTGPFPQAVRIITHDRQTFYNVCHHTFLDRDRGQMIHFEGTYTNDFSGNPEKTPRYNYNQMLYRLDLDADRLRAVQNR